MALQKRRMGKGRIHHRRSAWMRRAANKPSTQACPNCQQPRVAHRVCRACGFYGGEVVLATQTTEDEA
jgi:large subunit ribosomal protein L32